MTFSYTLSGRIRTSLEELNIVVERIKLYLDKVVTSND